MESTPEATSTVSSTENAMMTSTMPTMEPVIIRIIIFNNFPQNSLITNLILFVCNNTANVVGKVTYSWGSPLFPLPLPSFPYPLQF